MADRRMSFRDELAGAADVGDKTVTRRIGDKAPVAVGDRIAVCEALVRHLDERSGKDVALFRRDKAQVFRNGWPVLWPWKVRVLPARYCPAWAVRTYLRVIDVRRERLHEITGADVLAEGVGAPWNRLGVERAGGMTPEIERQLREVFARLWGQVHGTDNPDSWDANPMVWRIEFKREVRGG